MEQRGRLRHIRRAAGCTFAVVTAISLVAAPVSAAPRPGDEVRPRSLHLTMSAAGTRDYGVTVDTLGHHQVTLTVTKNNQIASYETRGKVSRHQVKANFGRFGRVNLRFHGKRRPFPAPTDKRARKQSKRRACSGRRPQREVGRFHGAVEFDGQNGYTRLALGKVQGEVRRTYPFGFNLTLLSARSRAEGALTRFTAITLEAPRGLPIARRDLFSVITASRQEKVGRVRVYRSVIQMAAPGRVKVSRRGADPQTARLALTSPFSGRAHYRGADKGSPASWTGNLGVRLLGTNLLPLTGPHFHTVLCRVSAFNPRQSCFRRAEARAARASNNLKR
jgi:hypothetical protein